MSLWMDYKRVSLATGMIFLLLALVLFFYPTLIYWLFGMNGAEPADVLARRAAVLFIALSFIISRSCNLQPSKPRQIIPQGIALALVALAILGVIELFRGTVGLGILVAIATEVILAVALLRAR